MTTKTFARGKAITPKVFEETKKYLSFASAKDTASLLGISHGTVRLINRLDTFDDYLAYNEERRTNYSALEKSNLKDLSGEPLFWEVHSTLARVPIKLIAQKAGLSLDEVSAMKHAQDYEEYLRIKDTHKYSKARNNPGFNLMLRKAKQEDIRKRYAGGETISDLAKAYNLLKTEIQAVIDEPESKEPNSRTERTYHKINRAIAEMIQDAKKQRIPHEKISKVLGISPASVSRALTRTDWSITDAAYNRWMKNMLTGTDKKFYREGEDIYMFSLRKYLGLDEYPYWWRKRPTTSPVIVPTEEAEQPEPAPEPKVVSTTVPVKLEQDGKNLTLTINLNLTVAL